jgi:thiol-disulfide isomerase/thioredoxin
MSGVMGTGTHLNKITETIETIKNPIMIFNNSLNILNTIPMFSCKSICNFESHANKFIQSINRAFLIIMQKKWLLLGLFLVGGLIAFYFYKKYKVAPAVNFSQLELTDLNNEKIAIENFKGKKLIISFGASWCPNCIDELNTLKKIKDKSLSDVEIVVISDEDVETISSWKTRKEYPFTFLKMNKPFNSVNIFSIPTTYILNTQLEVKKEKVGYIDWEDPSHVEHLKKLME